MSGLSLPLDPSVATSTFCGCGEGIAVSTPREIYNRAGLGTIAYRIGTHGDFKASLLARLTAADFPALRALTTRDESDPTIALLDATATLGDVLTFYQERIANESFLCTAGLWRSLAGLGRLIGYEPQPGLAATAYLAFVLETAAAAPESTVIPAGTRVQSIPAAGQLPQTFETSADFTARPEWNAMPALQALPPPPPNASTTSILVQGLATQARAGDRLALIDTAGNVYPVIALAVTQDAARATTRFDLAADAPAPAARTLAPPIVSGRPGVIRTRLTTQALSAAIFARAWDGADLLAHVQSMKWSLTEVMTGVREAASLQAGATGAAIRFRQRAAVFGHNAPAWNSLTGPTATPYQYNWDDFITLNIGWAANAISPPPGASGYGANTVVPLDHAYTGLAQDGWVLLEDAGQGAVLPGTIAAASDSSLVGFTLSAKVTQIDLGTSVDLSRFTRRGTTVWCDNEILSLADIPVTDDVAGDVVALDRIYLGLQAGQFVALTGTRTDLAGVAGTELAQIATITIQGNATWLTFAAPLAFTYDRATVALNANVVVATHGQTVTETLGGGSAGTPFQAFTLRQPPLTFVADPATGGPSTTLVVRVNGEAWGELPTLYGAAPTDRVFVTWLDETGNTNVLFGDGTTGARLPTGAGNVVATYRSGIGSAGLVGAGAVSLLATRPLGVRSVANPVPTSDAADADTPAMLQVSAPLHVLTLDRIVSLEDYANYARAYPGISKALASWVWAPRGRAVILTVAGQSGASIDPAAPLARSLVAAIAARSDPAVKITIADYTPVYILIGAAVKTDPSFVRDAVLAQVDSALRTEFAFGARDFGQSVLASEVVATIQGVAGVLACDLTLFCRPPDQLGVAAELDAATTAPGATRAQTAEILLLDPRPVPFTVMP